MRAKSLAASVRDADTTATRHALARRLAADFSRAETSPAVRVQLSREITGLVDQIAAANADETLSEQITAPILKVVGDEAWSGV